MNNSPLDKRNPYVNPFTDFGFKKLFGEKDSKESLINFLNDMLPLTQKIVDITYGNNEFLGILKDSRKSVFDIYCTDSAGNHFIVELQNASQEYFKDRALYYSTFAIQQQAIKGTKWDYRLDHVYCIALLGFSFPDEPTTPDEEMVVANEYLHTINLKDQNNKIFYKKLTYVFIEFPKFKKTEAELITHQDKWLYIFKNLGTLQEVPETCHERAFEYIFKKATVANFTPKELDEYLASSLALSDNINIINTAKKEGLVEGEAIGLQKGEAIGLQKGEDMLQKSKREIAIKLLLSGNSVADVVEYTGLHVTEVEKMR